MADVVFRTSGSTGAAKTVVRTEDALGADAARLVEAFPGLWESRPTVVATVRPEHMYGALWRVRAPAAAGCAVEPAVVLSVEELAAAAARHGRLLLVTTPSFLEKALPHPDSSALKGAFVGVVTSGSPLRRETALATRDAWGVCPTEIYGSTEAGSVAWRRRSESDQWTAFSWVGLSADADGGVLVDSPFALSRPWRMGDAVRLLSPTTFELLGRLDRRVKVLESYVSLPAVERALEAHPLVERAHAAVLAGGVARLGALVVLTAEGRAELARGAYLDLSGRLRRELLADGWADLPPAAFPRRIRFVRTFPLNAQGKVTDAAARAALADWTQEPVALDWRATAGELTARLVFPPDLNCFAGHFPGRPILPGVAQLLFVRHFARQAFPDFPDALSSPRIKFQQFIRPGEEVTLSVVRSGGAAFRFRYSSADGRPCASGVLEGCRP